MDKVTVRVATPVKAKDGILMPGSHEVDPETAAELAAAGALEPEATEEAAPETAGPELLTVSQDAIDEIVAAAVSAALVGPLADRDAAIARATDAEARVVTLEAEARDRAAETPTPGAPAADAPKKGKAAPKG